MPRIDAGRANVARAWNYMVGGKDNFAADREAARQLMEVAPVIRVAAPASRAFLGRTVRYLAGSRQKVTGFLAGLELVEPGLVTVPEWRPEAGAPAPEELIPLYGVVARKP